MPRDPWLQSIPSSQDRSQVSGYNELMYDETDQFRQSPQGPIARRAFCSEDDPLLSTLERAPQGSQSTSSFHGWMDRQAHSSLTSLIEATDTLPVDWNLFKRKRLSEGDVADLQDCLELSHNVRQIEPRRPSELDPSTLIDADLQRPSTGLIQNIHPSESDPSTLIDADLQRPLSRPGLVKNIHPSSLHQIPLRWIKATVRPLSAILNSWRRQRRVADQTSSFTRCLSSLASGLVTIILRFLSDCIDTCRQSWKMCWPILRWPLVFLVTFLVALNTIALAYTVTHEAFLSNFCVKELPLVRDWMCAVWDRRLQTENSVGGTGRFTDPLEAFLLRNSTSSSYVLPHILGRYETIVRSFKVNLPVSQFTTLDQDYLREQFTEFIDQSSVTIASSQEFHSHIMGTISRAVSNTQYYIDQISEHNLTSSPLHNEKTFEISFETDDSLSKSMAWFNSHYLVVLPAGLEPFRQRVVRVPYAESVWSLQKHLAFIADRLTVDIDMAITLKAQMQDQREIGQRIEERVALSRSINNVKLAQRSSWRFLIEHLLWKPLVSYQIEQRAQWLEFMAKVFDEYRSFLDSAIIDMETARRECNSFSTRLLEEVEQVTSGWAMTDWATHEISILKEGADNLKNLLKDFQLAQGRFYSAQFG